MRVPVKLLGFGFWLLSLNFAQCQAVTCELKSTTFGVKKIKPEGNTIFRAGESVEITCSEKHWFFFTKEKSRSYTCKDNGEWDYEPVCAVITCEDPRDQHVSTPYNWGTMKLGEKQSYSCAYGYRKTAAEATCTQDGWTPKPLCAEIMCDLPKFPNAEIDGGQRPNYRINSKVQYKCRPGFEPEEPVQITCDSQGQWTGIQQCTEVTCELKSTTFGVKKTNPYGKTIFRAGESVEITCSEKYWFFFTKEKSRSFTCKDNGQWDYEPVCAEITCEDPRDRHVSRPYYWGTMKLGEKQSYSCVSGYRKTAAEATCTQDGWTPKPLCAEIMCDLPKIPNAEILGSQNSNYKINSRIQYKCRSGFEPEESVQITCDSQGQWRGIQQCTAMCAAPKIKNAEIVGGQRPNYRINSKVEYKCRPGFEPEEPVQITCDSQAQWTGIRQCTEITCEDPRDQHVSRSYYWGTMKLGEKQSYSCESGYRGTAAEATCTRDGWTPKPLCAEIMCDLPKIPNAEVVGSQSENYKINSIIQYECQSGFEPEEPVQITCDSQGKWRGIQQCTAMCAAPKIKNAEIVGNQSLNYRSNSKVEYKCHPGFEPEKPVQITCDSQAQWTGIQQCTKIMCDLPKIPNAEIVGSQNSNYKINSRIQYKCRSGFEPEEPVQIICDSQGKWRGIQQCTEKCGPPPNISNADTKEMTKKQYNTEERVEYSCFDKYILDLRPPFSSYLTCVKGEWKGKIYCLKPCIVTVDEMDKRGIMLKWKSNEKIISTHNDGIEFACQSGKKFKDQNLPRPTCNDGVMNLPECEE